MQPDVIAYGFETGADLCYSELSSAAPAGAPGIRLGTGNLVYLKPGDTVTVGPGGPNPERRTVESIVRPNPASPNPNVLFTQALAFGHPDDSRVEGAALQTGVGFQPDYETEGRLGALEFAAGNFGLLESALEYARDDERPEVMMHGRRVSREPVTTTFDWVNERSMIRYSTNGKKPTDESPLWDSTGPREPGQTFHITRTTEFRWIATDIKGNTSEGRTKCVVMHTVGRTYARDAGVTLASLMDYLPQDNDPDCSAGFAHGLVTGVAPDRPVGAARGRGGVRGRRYALPALQLRARLRPLAHALYEDQLEPALELCTALGPDTAPDYAQGAYHDYGFAVVGADDARLARAAEMDPWRVCGSQPEEYVRPCWYRAFLENRPEGFTVETAADVEGLCDGLAGLQREGCITAASVIGPPDPAEQLRLCATLADPADAASCVRGRKAQNLLDAPAAEHVRLINGCERFGPRARAACYRWLGKILAVLTDGRFLRAGCPEVAAPAGRRQCEDGARTMEDALVTFS